MFLILALRLFNSVESGPKGPYSTSTWINPRGQGQRPSIGDRLDEHAGIESWFG